MPLQVNRHPPREEPEAGAPEWVVTFGDMMSLLLVFFVLIVSFSTLDVIKYRALVGSVKTAFGAKDASLMTGQEGPPTHVQVVTRRQASETVTQEEMEYEVRRRGLEDRVEVARTEEGVTLRIKDHLLFDLGRAELRPEAPELLAQVATLLRAHPMTVMVEGHTDDLPISTPLFRSNWELSAARAATVVRHLIQVNGFDPRRLAVMGMADTRPVAANDTPAGRARNRRVDFVLSNIPAGTSAPHP